MLTFHLGTQNRRDKLTSKRSQDFRYRRDLLNSKQVGYQINLNKMEVLSSHIGTQNRKDELATRRRWDFRHRRSSVEREVGKWCYFNEVY